jgi:exopolysaccharide biosynthesis polyprenyl glycosylphosphotransferase
MQRAMAHYVPREMAVLGLVELALSFLAIQSVNAVWGAPAWMTDIAGGLPGGSVLPAALVALAIAALGLPVGLYQPEVCLDRKRLLPAMGLSAGLLLAMLLAFGGRFTPARAIETTRLCAAALVTMTLIRLVWRRGFVRKLLVRPVLVLGDAPRAGAFNAHLQSRRGRNFAPVSMPIGDISWLGLRRRRIWGVVLVSAIDGPATDMMLDCKLRGLPVLTAEAFHDRYLGRIDLDSLTSASFLAGDGFARGRVSGALKRSCDLILGTALLLLTLPTMATAALAIKLDSAGPVFYRQQRTGRFGRGFTIYKFRSMTANAEASGKPRWAQRHDPRITRVGRFIRAARIDELPQLANIILGDMSLVGPRPERPHFVEQLARAIPFYHQRAYVKPGLTGWAQINYPYGASVEDAREKLAYDLYYVKHRTVWLDLVILLSTIRVVLFRDGAR